MGVGNYTNPFDIKYNSTLFVANVKLVEWPDGPQIWIQVADTPDGLENEIIWEGNAAIDKKMRFSLRSAHDGFVLSAPQTGTLVKKIESISGTEMTQLQSGNIPDRVKNNAVAVVKSPFQEDLQRRWFTRRNELLEAILALGFESPSLDTGNNPAAATTDPQDRELYNLLWGLVQSERPVADTPPSPVLPARVDIPPIY
jgi:hypothetical protein